MRQATDIRNFVKQSALMVGASLLGLAASAATAQANDPIYQVDLNKTQILRLPSAAGSVVIGNPMIADVSLHSPTTILVVGRGFGETNLIILDQAGHTMVDANIQVTSVTPSNGVRLFNAKSRETYSCAPYCQPSPVLGDAPEHISSNTPQIAAQAATASISDSRESTDQTSGLSDPMIGSEESFGR